MMMIFLPGFFRFFKGEIYVFVSSFPWRVVVIRCNSSFCFGAFCVGDLIFCFFVLALTKREKSGGCCFCFQFRVEKNWVGELC